VSFDSTTPEHRASIGSMFLCSSVGSNPAACAAGIRRRRPSLPETRIFARCVPAPVVIGQDGKGEMVNARFLAPFPKWAQTSLAVFKLPDCKGYSSSHLSRRRDQQFIAAGVEVTLDGSYWATPEVSPWDHVLDFTAGTQIFDTDRPENPLFAINLLAMVRSIPMALFARASRPRFCVKLHEQLGTYFATFGLPQ